MPGRDRDFGAGCPPVDFGFGSGLGVGCPFIGGLGVGCPFMGGLGLGGLGMGVTTQRPIPTFPPPPPVARMQFL
jgi:hypothetical protein